MAAIRRKSNMRCTHLQLSRQQEARKILTASLDRNVIKPVGRPMENLFSLLSKTTARKSGSCSSRGWCARNGRWRASLVTAYDLNHDGKIIVRTSTPDRPHEIFAAENGNPRRLTKQNDAFLSQIRLAQVEETKFKSADGTEVHGLLVRPVVRACRGRNPALLRPHGGPQSQYTQ